VIISFHIDRCDRNTHHSTDNIFAFSQMSRKEEGLNALLGNPENARMWKIVKMMKKWGQLLLGTAVECCELHYDLDRKGSCKRGTVELVRL